MASLNFGAAGRKNDRRADPQIPRVVGRRILTAAVAALAFVLKGFLEWWQKLVATRRARRASLCQLDALLRAARACIDVQVEHAKALCTSMHDKDELGSSIGYDEALTLRLNLATLKRKSTR